MSPFFEARSQVITIERYTDHESGDVMFTDIVEIRVCSIRRLHWNTNQDIRAGDHKRGLTGVGTLTERIASTEMKMNQRLEIYRIV
jgi:hypothetical protein